MDKNDLLELVGHHIERIDLTMREDVDNLSTYLDEQLITILRYGLFGGGKRFRPLLAVLCCQLCGDDEDTMYHLAIAFEYLHLATLFHDDVIDQADMRRGRTSVCKRYGTAAAILAGDFLHARSMELVGRYGKKESLAIVCQATAGMVDGEFKQLKNTENLNLSEKDYYAAIEGKTALLISATTEIGALQGEASDAQQEALKTYGQQLGYGFQIVDDLLDYQGLPEKTGKPLGTDLYEGKITLPLLIALQRAEKSDRLAMQNILQSRKLRQKSLDTVLDFIGKYDGFSHSREKAKECIGSAIQALKIFPSHKGETVRALEGLAMYTLQRDK